ncbi:MAG: hypothetical protein IJW84_02760 [Alphaproteobacteria bacterium]|nr:hypothetical protein [Alphaproteobacteria bacterium]
MKVKNIAFSGFAAMIFAGLCGAADAASVNLASKSYVDTQLAGKANLIDLEALETTVGQKATQESLNTVATQVNQNTLDIADLKAAGYLTETDLNNLKTTLQAAIDDKQAKGDYADAAELETLKTTVETLQSGTVDKTVVENLQTTVNTISADYAKKSELTSAEERLQAAIDAIKIPDVSNLVTNTQLTELRTALETEIAKKQDSGDYATADALTAISTELGTLKNNVYTKDVIDQKIADAVAGGEIDLDGYATTSALDALTALVNGNTNEITALKNAGYQTSAQVQSAIEGATASLATTEALNNLQSTLQAAINEKQAKGDYLVAADLTELSSAVAALESGKADASTVSSIQETIGKLGDTYASKSELTSAEERLQAAIDAIDVPSLTEYAKTADVNAALELKADKSELTTLATTEALNNLQSTLQAAIDEKQAKGEYLVAADLQTLDDAVTALQSGKADASTVTTIQETISKLGDTYATKSDMTAADTALQNAIDAIEIPSLEGYAKTADVDAALALKADKSELTNLVTSTQLTALRTALETEIAKKQDSGDYAAADALTAISTELSTLKGDVYTKAQVDAKIADAVSGGEIDLSGYAKQVDLDSLTALVNGNTAEITTLKNAGYQTSTQVSEAIAAATTTLATKDELNAKQDTLTAGTGITITDNTISASVDTSSFIINPTNPGLGDYVLYASCTSKKCVYSLASVDEILGSSSGGGGYDDF